MHSRHRSGRQAARASERTGIYPGPLSFPFLREKKREKISKKKTSPDAFAWLFFVRPPLGLRLLRQKSKTHDSAARTPKRADCAQSFVATIFDVCDE